MSGPWSERGDRQHRWQQFRGAPRPDAPTNPNEICRALAERCGGRAESLYAPAYVEGAEVRDQLLAQEAISKTLQRAAQATMALVGIGGTDDDCTLVRAGCLTTGEIDGLRSRGAVGDVLGNYVDLAGEPVRSAHQNRLVALSIDELRHIGTVMAMASEPEKPASILGILRARVVDVLLVDEGNARAVLEAAQSAPRPHSPASANRRSAGFISRDQTVADDGAATGYRAVRRRQPVNGKV